MASLFFSLLLSFIMLNSKALSLGLVEKPVNTAVMANEDSYLNCSVTDFVATKDAITWSSFPTSDSTGDQISVNGALIEGKSEFYAIEGEFNLKIKQARPTHAVKHKCEQTGATDRFKEVVEFIVLDDLTVETNGPRNDGSAMEMSCKSTYQGNILPKLDLLVNGISLGTPSNMSTKGLAKIAMNQTVTKADHQKMLTCMRFFDPAPPVFRDNKSVVLLVNHSPTAVKFYPDNSKKLSLPVGSSINCTADGYPVPDYKWIRVQGKGPAEWTGPVLKLTSDMQGTTNVFQCNASNTVGGKKLTAYDRITFTVGVSAGAVLYPVTWLMAVLWCIFLSSKES